MARNIDLSESPFSGSVGMPTFNNGNIDINDSFVNKDQFGKVVSETETGVNANGDTVVTNRFYDNGGVDGQDPFHSGMADRIQELTYDSNGNLESATEIRFNIEDGRREGVAGETRFEYERHEDGSYKETKTELGEGLVPDSKIETDYNSDGNMHQQVETRYSEDSPGKIEYQKETTYDENGRIEHETHDYFDSKGNIESKIEVNRDPDGDSVESTRTTYEYDVDGNLEKENSYTTDTDGVTVTSESTTYEVDENGNPDGKTVVSEDYKNNTTVENHYDKNDNLENSKITMELKNGDTIERTSQYDTEKGGDSKSLISSHEEVRDKDGNLDRETDKSFTDGALDTKTELYYHDDGGGVETITKYDEDGERVSKTEKTYDDNGEVRTYVDTHYDEDGRVTDQTTATYDENGHFESGQRTDFEYDENGNAVSETKDLDQDPIKEAAMEISDSIDIGDIIDAGGFFEVEDNTPADVEQKEPGIENNTDNISKNEFSDEQDKHNDIEQNNDDDNDRSSWNDWRD